MPRSAQDIPLKKATEEILRGPQTIIHCGSNNCLMQERLAIRNLLHAEDQVDKVRRFLVVESRLYSPSTINRRLTTLDVPGEACL
jgi:SOS response regulatory protein OraA/RecX